MKKAKQKAQEIAKLNDQFRQNLKLGRVILTGSVWVLQNSERAQLLKLVAEFDAFTDDNDPYKERDFGTVTFAGERFYWKIDYYDLSEQHHSPDAADPTVTKRVMTVMHSSEY